jgi:hypothetical protein
MDVLPSTIASIDDPSADRSTLNDACFAAFEALSLKSALSELVEALASAGHHAYACGRRH